MLRTEVPLTDLAVFVACAVALAFIAGAVCLGLLAAGVVLVCKRCGLLRSQEDALAAEKRLAAIEHDVADARAGILNLGMQRRVQDLREKAGIPEQDGPRIPDGMDPEIIDNLEGVGGAELVPTTFDAVKR